MELLNDKIFEKSINKPEIERLEKEKHEEKLIGSFLRRRGHKLFSYNPLKNELIEIDIKKNNTLQIINDKNSKLITKDLRNDRININNKHIIFQCLNMENAQKRLKKYKNGDIKELCNLKPAGNKISFW
jgi:nitrogenase subunit NifH